MSVLTTDKNITHQIATSIRQKINVDADKFRADALQVFQTLGLPYPKHEEYKYTPITRTLEKNFAFAPSAASGPLSDVKEFFIPGIEGNRIVFIDGVFSKDHSSINSNQVHIQKLTEAFDQKNADAV